MFIKPLSVAAVSAALIAGTAGPAAAASTLLGIERQAALSPTGNIVTAQVLVTCTEDTTAAGLTATFAQATAGGIQQVTSQVAALNALECSGEEELLPVRFRRPVGGFKWVIGPGRVSAVTFNTIDPGGNHTSSLAGRTVSVSSKPLPAI